MMLLAHGGCLLGTRLDLVKIQYLDLMGTQWLPFWHVCAPVMVFTYFARERRPFLSLD